LKTKIAPVLLFLLFSSSPDLLRSVAGPSRREATSFHRASRKFFGPLFIATSRPSGNSGPSGDETTSNLVQACAIQTSARRYKALGRARVFRLYVRNFWSETIHHRPKDLAHEDVRL